jgi:hypothetical protein
MIVSLIALLAIVAVLSTGLALLTSNNSVAILAGVIGAFAGGLLAIGLQNVEVVSNGSVVDVGAYPALTLFALALTVTAAWPALTGPVALADETRDSEGLPPLKEM